jgi:hypothetical protein
MITTAPKPVVPWLMLVSRSALFLSFQALFAVLFALAGNSSAWLESARWWPFVAIFTNLVSIVFLIVLFRKEGKQFFQLLRFSRETVKKDLLWLLGLTVIGGPIMALPMNIVGKAIFGDPMIPTNMMFRPLPTWAFILAFLFPLTIAFAELPTYFVYVMPRLAAQLKNGWTAWLIAALILGAQHIFLPFIPDWRFILWRLLMYIPFALFAGLVIKLRPTMLPYYLIIHALVDISAVLVYVMI